MIQKLTCKIHSFLTVLESKVGLLAASLLLGVVMLLLAVIYLQQSSFNVVGLATYTAELSKHPFRFADNNPLQYRILAPFIGYIIFLRGDLFFIVPILFDVFLLATVYHHYRKLNYEVEDAFIMTALICFSGTILIPLGIFTGYIDSITYFFLFLAFAKAARIKSSAFFYCLALLNHETSLVLLPGLFLYAWHLHKGEKLIVLKLFFSFLLSCLPFIGYRYYVSHHADILYSFDFYFSDVNIRPLIQDTLDSVPIGAFYSFRLLWFFPAYTLFKLWQQKEKQLAYVILLIIMFTLTQLLIAYDTTRLVCLAFPAILLSAEYVKKIWSADYFRSFSLKLLLFNLLVIPYCIGNDEHSLVMKGILHLIDFINARL